MSIGKSFITAVTVIAIFVGLGIGASMVGIPLWPFVMFLLWYTSVNMFDGDNFWNLAIGGFIGIILGFTTSIVAYLVDPTGMNANAGMIGLAVFGVIALIVVTLLISGKFAVLNPFMAIIMTIMTVFTLFPAQLAGSTAPVTEISAAMKSIMLNPSTIPDALSKIGAAISMTPIEALIRVLISYAIAVIVFFFVKNAMAKSAAKA